MNYITISSLFMYVPINDTLFDRFRDEFILPQIEIL